MEEGTIQIMNRFSRRHSAYTLVEILVVMAIIAMLSALLFAVFSRVREKGRAAQCQSNLRQLALAFQQYSSDNGTFPCWYNSHQPSNPLPSNYPGLPWAVRIQPYVKDTAIFKCPSESTPANSDPMYPSGGDNDQLSSYTSYSYNLNLSSLPDSKVTRSSEVIMIFDNGPGAGFSAQNGTPGPMPSGNGDIHNGGANFAFVDGHVKWFRVWEPQTYFTVQ